MVERQESIKEIAREINLRWFCGLTAFNMKLKPHTRCLAIIQMIVLNAIKLTSLRNVKPAMSDMMNAG